MFKAVLKFCTTEQMFNPEEVTISCCLLSIIGQLFNDCDILNHAFLFMFELK